MVARDRPRQQVASTIPRLDGPPRSRRCRTGFARTAGSSPYGSRGHEATIVDPIDDRRRRIELELEWTGRKTKALDCGIGAKPADAAWVGEEVAFVVVRCCRPDQAAQQRVWKAKDGPGAWLTHGKAPAPVEISTDDGGTDLLVDDVAPDRGRRRRREPRAIDAEYVELRADSIDYLVGGGRLAVVKAPPGFGQDLHADRGAGGPRGRRAADRRRRADEQPGRRHLPAARATTTPRSHDARFASSGQQPPAGLPGQRCRGSPTRTSCPTGPASRSATTAKWSLTDVAAPYDLLAIDEAWQMSWADLMQCALVSEQLPDDRRPRPDPAGRHDRRAALGDLAASPA